MARKKATNANGVQMKGQNKAAAQDAATPTNGSTKTSAKKAAKSAKNAAGNTNAPQAAKVVDNTLYVATDKEVREGTFFHKVQLAAAKPIKLSDLITKLQENHKAPEGDKALVPKSKKDHDMVVRVRTGYAANHGYLKAVGEPQEAA